VLSRAAANTQPMCAGQHEWIVDVGEEPLTNFTSIVRYPYRAQLGLSGYDAEAEKALTKLLETVELVLTHGVPASRKDGSPYFSCGGYRHYLGRDLVDSDELTLLVYRHPFLRCSDHNVATGEYYDLGAYDWLAEFSLMVRGAVSVAA